jgi:hypothetical protein
VHVFFSSLFCEPRFYFLAYFCGVIWEALFFVRWMRPEASFLCINLWERQGTADKIFTKIINIISANPYYPRLSLRFIHKNEAPGLCYPTKNSARRITPQKWDKN